MPPRKRKAAAPAGVDEADAPAVDLAPVAAVDDEQPARHASEGGATAGPGDAHAPVVETEEAGTGVDAPCVAVSGEEPEVDALEGEDTQPHAQQPGGDDGGGIHSAEAPHAAPVASSVRACLPTHSHATLLACPRLVATHARTQAGVSLPLAAVHNLTRPHVCVRLLGCAQAPQEWELAPAVPAECTLSPAFRLSQLPDGTNVEEVSHTLPGNVPRMRAQPPGQRPHGVSRCCRHPWCHAPATRKALERRLPPSCSWSEPQRLPGASVRVVATTWSSPAGVGRVLRCRCS